MAVAAREDVDEKTRELRTDPWGILTFKWWKAHRSPKDSQKGRTWRSKESQENVDFGRWGGKWRHGNWYQMLLRIPGRSGPWHGYWIQWWCCCLLDKRGFTEVPGWEPVWSGQRSEWRCRNGCGDSLFQRTWIQRRREVASSRRRRMWGQGRV